MTTTCSPWCRASKTGRSPVSLQPYGIIARQGRPEVAGIYLLHEGIVRASDGTIEEIDYKDLPDFAIDPSENAPSSTIDVTDNGWMGITDKYWMTTLIAEPGQPFKSVAKYTVASDTYQTDMRLPTIAIAPGDTATATTLFRRRQGSRHHHALSEGFGNKPVRRFRGLGLVLFPNQADFWVLHLLNGLIGNMGFAIIGLTLMIKTLLFPLAYKSYVSMSKMKKLQPEMEKSRNALATTGSKCSRR